MAEGYWRYADPRQQAAIAPPPASLKRHRPEFGGAPETLGYYPREEERKPHYPTEAVNTSYDRYLQNGVPSYPIIEPTKTTAGLLSRPIDDPRLQGDNRIAGFGGGRHEASLPLNASNTLFVEGIPANCARREVSHIFRPFIGFRDVRIVNKESRNAGEEPLVLCFVDFVTAGHAASALEALQGYQLDEHDRDSASLRIQFARFPGPRSSGGPRNRR